MGGVDIAVYGLMQWMDLPLPAPPIMMSATALMFVVFFVGALGEELGWSGYITATLQERWNALQTGLLLGPVAVLWHMVPLLLMHRSPSWIARWCLYVVASCILIVWLYNHTGQSVVRIRSAPAWPTIIVGQSIR